MVHSEGVLDLFPEFQAKAKKVRSTAAAQNLGKVQQEAAENDPNAFLQFLSSEETKPLKRSSMVKKMVAKKKKHDNALILAQTAQGEDADADEGEEAAPDAAASAGDFDPETQLSKEELAEIQKQANHEAGLDDNGEDLAAKLNNSTTPTNEKTATVTKSDDGNITTLAAATQKSEKGVQNSTLAAQNKTLTQANLTTVSS